MRKPTRKRVLWCLGVVCVFAAGLALFAWLTPKLRVSQETFSMIRPNMTEAEIEGLFGGRGSKTVLGVTKYEGVLGAWTAVGFEGSHQTLNAKAWRTPDKCIKVGFDTNGKAVYAIITMSTAQMTLWQKLRWWIGF